MKAWENVAYGENEEKKGMDFTRELKKLNGEDKKKVYWIMQGMTLAKQERDLQRVEKCMNK